MTGASSAGVEQDGYACADGAEGGISFGGDGGGGGGGEIDGGENCVGVGVGDGGNRPVRVRDARLQPSRGAG